MVKSKRIDIQPYIGLIPGMVLFLTFVIVPALYNFYYAVTDYNGFPGSHPQIVGLSNFIDALSLNRDSTLSSIKISFVYAILITSIQNIAAVVVAIMLSVKIRLGNFFRALYFFPNVLGAFVIAQIWGLLMNPNFGPLTKLCEIIGFSPDFLGDPSLVVYSIVFIQVWISMGYAMIIYYTNVMSIPADLLEAADIDGTSFFQKIRHIVLPLIAPSFTINILLSLIGSLKLFDIIYLLTRGGPGISSQNLPVYIFSEAFDFSRQGYGAALNVIQFAIIFCISVLVLNVLKKRETDY